MGRIHLFAGRNMSQESPVQVDRDRSPSSPIRIAIVNDEHEKLLSIRQVVDAEPDLVVVGSARRACDVLRLTETCRPQVLMLGLSHSSSSRAMEQLPSDTVGRNPAVLAVLNEDDQDEIVVTIGSGALGICSWADPPDLIVQSVRSIACELT